MTSLVVFLMATIFLIEFDLDGPKHWWSILLFFLMFFAAIRDTIKHW